MDRQANWTSAINVTSPIPPCSSNSTALSTLDRSLVITPSSAAIALELKWFFLLHTYGFACLFFILSFYTFFSILNLRSLISSRPFMSTINGFLCLLGASRSGCLFIDPYNLKQIFPRVIGSILWDIGFACTTSAFCLIQLAFLQLTQLKIGPEKIQRESCLSLIITANFFFIIASDMALAYHNHYIAKYVIQVVFVIWSIVLYLMFLKAGYRIMNLLHTVPVSMLTRDASSVNQKGLMQLAMLAPYNNLASSVAAALVPTLLAPKLRPSDEKEVPASPTAVDSNNTKQVTNDAPIVVKTTKGQDTITEQPLLETTSSVINFDELQVDGSDPNSTVPEVYIRPPTPTPSIANLPMIMVSSPSRRSSLASRRGSDSSRTSRRSSECSVRFTGDQGETSPTGGGESKAIGAKGVIPVQGVERPRTPDQMLRRHSENISPMGSCKDLRRCSDVTHEKNRGSQFAVKLRRNSDFGNRTPRRMLPLEQQSRLPQVLDCSPTESRRNSDFALAVVKPESRRNSDVQFTRRSSEMPVLPLNVTRRSSEISIRNLDKSPTHFQRVIPINEAKPEVIPDKSESDSDQADCNEKAALMNETPKTKSDEAKQRKKSLTWKNEKNKEDTEEITAETSLLPEATVNDNCLMGSDFTLHSILNHIAYVNRTKSNIPLHIPESATAAARKSQIKRVLQVAFFTAIIGIILCIANFARIFGPYGLLAETVKYGTRPSDSQYPQAWPWFMYQTLCRFMEFIMGCAMANITKQPSVSPRHRYNYPGYNLHAKQRNSLYI